MNQLLQKIGLRGSILTLLALPLLVLTAFCSWTAWNSWRTAAEMRQMSALAGVAPSISSLVHELQKERGSSAGFIGSRGRKTELRQRLANQRPETDQSLQNFEQTFETFQVSSYGDVFSSKFRQAQNSLSRLSQERAAVDDLRHSTPEMARYYTGAITDLLGLIETMPTLSRDADVATAISGYLSLLHAKERAGRERAMGAAGFGAGTFSSGLHSRLVRLIGQQEAYIAAFDLGASDAQKAYYQQQLSGTAVSEVNRLRKIAIDSPFTGDLQNVSGGTWFDVSTKRINLLKNVEDRLAGDLTALVDNLQSEAQGTFFSLASGLVVLILALGGFGFMIVASITRPISEIAHAVGQYQPGDRLTMPATDRGDELGQLARSLDIIGETGLEAARLRAALDSCQTSVMVADPGLNIIYLNSNMQNTLKAAEVGIRRDLPQFSADHLLGTNIGVFYKDNDQRGALANLHSSHKTNIEIGGRKVALIASPVQSASGERLGVVVEWNDRTAELTAMEEIDGVVAAANRGDLGQRLQLEGKEGFMLGLAKGINQLTGMIDEVIGNVGSILEGLAQGDLSQKIAGDYDGKFGQLKNNANDTIDQLIGIVSNIQSASEEVKNAAAEITSGTSDLSDRTEQAATNLEETAASTEQMSATVKQNAVNAGRASELANEADKSAKSGGEVVEQAVTAMAEIEQSAQKITDIIGVIDEIAFQTNLLALNASVEAARAGEAGKGFAVVAQEVRQLAQRSAQAASDIKDLIQSSNGQVQDGVLLVNQAGGALETIVDSIGKVTKIVNEISSASQEQAAGVQEINSSITSMDEMTQQNSALVEESTAAARSMSNQAERLAEEMAFFRLGADQVSRPGQPKAARPMRQASRQPISVNKAEPALADDDWSEF